MKKLFALVLCVLSFAANALDSKSISNYTECSLNLGKSGWSNADRNSIANQFENGMKPCRRLAYYNNNWDKLTPAEKEKVERIMTYIELESIQMFRQNERP